jgi:hypothetical protein
MHIARALAAAAVAFATAARAQDPDTTAAGDWQIEAKAGMALTQSSFTRNWQGDEVGTVSWLSSTDFLASRQVHPKVKWDNTLALAFGQTHQQDAERELWLAPVKSADKIDYDGIVRLTLGKWVDPYVAGTFDSQFFQSVPGLGTRALNPILVSESAGLARALLDEERRKLLSRVGFALRQRIDRLGTNDLGGRETDTTNDGGFEWVTTGRFATAEDRNVFDSELRFFQAVFFSESDLDPEDHWKTVDVRWQNKLSNKVYKWLSLDVYAELLYDKQVSRAGQFKQTLGVGMTWQLI